MKNTIFFFLLLLSLSISAQSQITWNMGMNIAASTSGNEHPRIVTDAASNPLVLWGHSSRAMFSRWNGSTFTTPVMVNPMSMTIAHAGWMGPDIASHGDTVYVVMKQTPEADTSSHIYLVRSFDGGITFSAPFQIDNIGDSISRFPTVTTDDTGNPIVGFMKFNSTFGDARWVVTKSSDYGMTFSTDVKASGWSAIGATVCDCCPGSIVSDANNVAMLYRDNNSNIRDSWAGISYNGGSSFSNGVNIDQNNWMLMSCPATGPDGVIIGDSLYTVFMNGASGTAKVYRSVSSISNATSQPSQLVTGNIPGLSSQNYPRIASNGNAVAIVWQQAVSGTAQLPILFTNDINNGFPAMYDTVDLANITNADVAVVNGKVFVVWQDDGSGTVKYRTGTFTPVNTSVHSLNNITSIIGYPNPVSSRVINIPLPYFNNLNVEYTVSNLLARELIHAFVTIENGLLKVDVSSLQNGTYFLKIISGSQSSVVKIVKE
ncbi:MAG: T9SS type A sorting domain-containing protein [Bacteroidia bacterium]